VKHSPQRLAGDFAEFRIDLFRQVGMLPLNQPHSAFGIQ